VLFSCFIPILTLLALQYFKSIYFIPTVEDNILIHTARQLSPAKIGGSVVLRCEVSPQIGLVDITWLQDGLPMSSGFSSAGKAIENIKSFNVYTYLLILVLIFT
jgi:hypothetical protein